jgi:ParB-like chromosome segregation protein Spo0J
MKFLEKPTSIEEINPSELIVPNYYSKESSIRGFCNLKQSILKFGVIIPVLINENPLLKNRIIDGCQRVKASFILGKFVPCIYVDVSQSEEIELSLSLNKKASDWNYHLLNGNFNVSQLIASGFDVADFCDIKSVNNDF